MTFGPQSKTQMDAVRRRLAGSVREAGEVKVLTISQVYDARLDDVWDACTNPERIPRWFLPVTGELKVGGHYQITGNAGGTVEACTPPDATTGQASFGATWEFDGRVSWIEVRLTAEPDGRTRFSLDHIAHPDDHWAQYGPAAVGIGWELALLGFALHLGGAPKVDPAQMEAWWATPEAVAFMTRSGELWGDAEAAAGEDPAVAAARAARTIAFYTAAPGA